MTELESSAASAGRNIREQLEDARDHSPLFNTKKWTRDFEQCLEMAWSRYEQGLEPDEIGVEITELYTLNLLSAEKKDDGGNDGSKKINLLTVNEEGK